MTDHTGCLGSPAEPGDRLVFGDGLTEQMTDMGRLRNRVNGGFREAKK